MKVIPNFSQIAVSLLLAAGVAACAENPVVSSRKAPVKPAAPKVSTEPKADAEVSVETLLREMTDRRAMSYYPASNYKCKQASSYDRRAKVPNPKDGEYHPNAHKPVGEDRDGGKGWFANGDGYKAIGKVTRQGRREEVIMRHNAPGAIVRIWNALGSMWCFDNTVVRIYIDGSHKPALEMEVTDLVGGNKLAPSPYSYFVSKEEKNIKWRGRNIYFPIPYQKSCLVTVDRTKRKKGTPGHGFFYQINYREYPKGTKVKSFTMNQVKAAKGLIAEEGKNLLAKPTFKDAYITKAAPTTIKPGGSVELKFAGTQAIENLAISLNAKDQKQALRSTVLEMFCDGKRTIWAPIGGFFGLGYTTNPVETFYYKHDGKGNFNSYWVMPFQKTARVIVHNYGDQPVELSKFRASAKPYTWTKRSMHLNSVWHELRKWDTNVRIDEPYAIVDGKGVWVGDSLTVFNTYTDWWGEGDEKIFVDKEKFPSHFGTGTEDYYGYAWCRPYPFSFPFNAQADGSGNKAQGMSVNSRVRALDAIPFKTQIRFYMEVWHPFRTPTNFAPTAIFYARPDAKCNFKPNIKAVQYKVARKASDVLDKNTVRFKRLLNIKKDKPAKKKK